MKPKHKDLASLLVSKSNESSIDELANAHNYLCEERVSSDIQKHYEDTLSGTLNNFSAWNDAHWNYLKKFINVNENRLAVTFSNVAAALKNLEEEQYLIRLERLDYFVKSWDYEFMQIIDNHKSLHSSTVPVDERDDAEAFLDDLTDAWNHSQQRRDYRPTFATFQDNLEYELSQDNCFDLIRNRLGLMHLNVATSQHPIPVALMRYKVKDVLAHFVNRQALDLDNCAFTVPTVLDAGLNPWFYPSPKSADYGRTLCLFADAACEQLSSEILHFRIPYQAKHIYRLGHITQAVNMSQTLEQRRDEHLFCLRYETDNENFGLLMDASSS